MRMNVADTITNYAANRSHSAVIEEADFQAIYGRTARPLWAYLQRDVADDLLQEAYCRFLARKPRDLDAQQTRSYLFRIATNLLHDRWRRGDGDSSELNEDTIAPEKDEAAQMDVRRAMQQLKPRERQLLWLAYVEGMSHAEIAAVTGLRALSIRLLLFRARRHAAELLEPSTIMVKE
jgi:RNA polymerase sigma-70 factor (ECF subfamily)